MRISVRADYGIVFLMRLARTEGGKLVSLRSVHAQDGIPYPFLAKLARSLSKAGIVECKRGPGGGFRLARPQDTITIGEVVRALEGGIDLVRCVVEPKERSCPIRELCVAHDPWQKMKVQMAALMNQATLADFSRANVRSPHTLSARPARVAHD